MNSDDVRLTAVELTSYIEDYLSDEPEFEVDPAVATTALQLLADECGVRDPGELADGDVTRLLLQVYPAARPDDDPNDVVNAVDLMIDFAFDSERIDEGRHATLLGELDDAETALFGALDRPRLAENEPDLKTLYNLPDRLGPIRLPAEDELAAAARRSPLLTQARALAASVADGHDLAAAADTAGVAETDLPTVAELASHVGFVEFDSDDSDDSDESDTADESDESDEDGVGETVPSAGPAFDEWPGGDDDDVLTVWGHALNTLLAWSLPADADRAGEETLDFTGTSAWFVPLLLTWRVGLPVRAISDMMADLATDDLPADDADAAWRRWSAEHGDPAEVLLGRLAGLGAVELDEEHDSASTEGTLVRLTPLAAASLRGELVASGVDMPLLPAPEDMTAADLIDVATHGLDGEIGVEAPAWFTAHPPLDGARALLAVAADAEASRRAEAVALLRQYAGADAEAAWREVLDSANLQLHARLEIAALRGEETDLSDGELAWLAVDTIAGKLGHHDTDVITAVIEHIIPAGATGPVDGMGRVDHPDAVAVLTAVGQHHPDKPVAKAARKALHRAADRARS
ncbi:hypothetical protein GCM10009676_37360 [Prauserella halophila]|uniref:XPB/Ssl2-like helicase family protein n=1 Tax=Prauserella halophila TaxID=185641 RepID=A0ABN1WEZ7_9PSEU|nr:hypothetical protein [Prauserella halophila]MCP2238017.1 hypothetical protein [Prauserella halophila]